MIDFCCIPLALLFFFSRHSKHKFVLTRVPKKETYGDLSIKIIFTS